VLRRDTRADAGFTLVELLLAVVILGVIALPLANVLISYFKTTDVSVARLSESHDAQMATMYFAQDVQALGVRDYTVTGTAFFPLTQSMETGAAATGGRFPCGDASTPAAALRLAWDEFTAGPGTRQTRIAAYVVQGSELHRLTCSGGSLTPTSDLVLARNLTGAAVAVACTDSAGAPVSCTGPTPIVPSAVSLTLTLRNPGTADDNEYEITLTGQRRQT
jgi:prepilin-type N-terminal cleavage/methylation domain-containing protein